MASCDSLPWGGWREGFRRPDTVDKPLSAFARDQPHPSPEREFKANDIFCRFIGYYSLKRGTHRSGRKLVIGVSDTPNFNLATNSPYRSTQVKQTINPQYLSRCKTLCKLNANGLTEFPSPPFYHLYKFR